ncbi:hypothetical protein AXG93_3102s1550 [Marchantia polymorpha subsp. ruderalis]|uniref:Tetratricopeptide repeat protein 38 n=1 Tax=Marchantia polymorpha subsp. ruderalis TaxID=1480154 RepID=A0A176W894_MARPO|nr:hypothetical protein AXG93_3102s1550 [Marchantia polymorpha subsp. ruderalis]
MPVRTSRKHPLDGVRAQGEGSVHFSEAKVNAMTVESLSDKVPEEVTKKQLTATSFWARPVLKIDGNSNDSRYAKMNRNHRVPYRFCDLLESCILNSSWENQVFDEENSHSATYFAMASSSVEKPDPAISYKNDLWGYEVRSSSDDCITFLNKYYIEVLSYGRDKRVILQAADADNCCALACGLAAVYLWAPQKSTTLPPRALIYLTAAKENLVLESYPRDLLTLKRGQTLCFNMGRSADMLRLALKALPFNVERGYVFGMLAFALVEVGSIREGESAARMALTIEAQDIWAQHATYINALGLLLRMEIRVDSSIVQERILQVVSSLKERAFEHQELLLDLLAIWAFGRADQPEEAIEMAESVKSKNLAPNSVDVLLAPQCRVLINHSLTVSRCSWQQPCASAEGVLGASNEQLDVFEDLWCISSLRAGHVTQVVEVAERLTREKPGISFAWRVLEEAYSKSGQAPEAIFAGSRARVLELAGEEELLNMSSLYL